MKAAVSWSGGKDACLAWRHAREAGARVASFLTMCDGDGLSKSHALPAPFLQAQAAAGVELDESFAGADYDAALLQRLPPGVCPVGEEGEFHTFVHDAPGFAAPLAVRCGMPRRVASQPPFAPTTFVLATPAWMP